MLVAVCFARTFTFFFFRMFSDIQNKVFAVVVQLLIDHSAEDVRALLGCYAATIGNLLPTFRDNLSVPPSEVKNHACLFVYIIVWNVTDIHMIH
jgi:hypothetical protein